MAESWPFLPKKTLQALDGFLPPHWSHNNPIDILGDADSERYAKALEIAANDPDSDGLLVILAPQGMTDPAAVAEGLKPYAKSSGKPVLTSWMGGASIAPGEAMLNAAGIPTFPYPDTAARAFTYMWRYSYNLRGLYETPSLAEGQEARPVVPTPGGKHYRDRPQPGPGVAERVRIQTDCCRTTAFLRSKPGSRAAKTKP